MEQGYLIKATTEKTIYQLTTYPLSHDTVGAITLCDVYGFAWVVVSSECSEEVLGMVS